MPASMTGRTDSLFLGRIVDADEVYVNGQHIGGITYQYPPRRYAFQLTVEVRQKPDRGEGHEHRR